MDLVKFPVGHDVYADDLGDPDPSAPSERRHIVNIAIDELLSRTGAVVTGRGVAEGLTLTPITNAVRIETGKAYDFDQRRLVVGAPITVPVVEGDQGGYLLARIVPTGQIPVLVYGRTYYKQTLDIVFARIGTDVQDDEVRLGRILLVRTGAAPTVSANPIDRDVYRLRYKYPSVTVTTDGTGDYATIQEAIDALANGGGLIQVAPGTYAVITDLVISGSNIRIVGSGASTIIQVNSAALSAFAIDGGASTTISSGVSIESLAIDLNYAASIPLIRATNTRNLAIRDLLLTNGAVATGATGVAIEDLCEDVVIKRTRVNGLATAISITGGSTRGVIVGPGVRATAFATAGVTVSGSALYTRLIGSHLTGAGGTSIGVNVLEAVDVNLSGLDIQSCQKGVYVANTKAAQIVGNVIINNSGQGVHLAATSSKACTMHNLLAPNGSAYQDDADTNLEAKNIKT